MRGQVSERDKEGGLHHKRDRIIELPAAEIIKNRGHFPTEDAAVKLLYLGIRNTTGRHIDGGGTRGTGTYGRKTALNHFAVVFGDRLPL